MKNILIKNISQAVTSAGYKSPASFNVDEPPKGTKGDWATNVAMAIAGANKSNPKETAEKIKTELLNDSDIESVEIAGPGFINITLKNEIYLSELKNIIDQKTSYGHTETMAGKKVNVEYISANPTGPLHIGNARSGPIGEAFANLYESLGAKVEREFYVNDIGVQIGRFGKSLYHWYKIKQDPGTEFPEDGYPGGYIKETSENIQKDCADDINKIKGEPELIEFFAKGGLKLMVENIKADAKLLDIEFDRWTYESEALENGKSRSVVQQLTEKGHTAEKDGAIWFARPEDKNLEDKDSVLVKSDENKTLTYFANDIAYHVEKLSRADLLIDIWGANHFVHIPRIKSALSALGYSEDKINIIVYQYVRLKKSGVALSMGKRLGNFVTLREVIEGGVAADAFKYFILSQNPNTPIDFDIELAADTSEKNPVYYIKYAHARICSILRKIDHNVISTPHDSDFVISTPHEVRAEKSSNDEKISRQARDDSERGTTSLDLEGADLSLLKNPKEIALYKELVKFPELIEQVSKDFQIQAIPHFAYKIATLFHDFYGSCKVLGEEKELEKARLALILATKYVLKNALNICGIEAPEKM